MIITGDGTFDISFDSFLKVSDTMLFLSPIGGATVTIKVDDIEVFGSPAAAGQTIINHGIGPRVMVEVTGWTANFNMTWYPYVLYQQ